MGRFAHILCFFLMSFMGIVYGSPNSAKHRFHSTIYIFKNYFITVFLIINFQFQ